jgi:mono/diheme cytochrome c family protein
MIAVKRAVALGRRYGFALCVFVSVLGAGGPHAAFAQADGGNAQQDFLANCSICHGKDGRSGLKDLTAPAFQQSITDEQIAVAIREGPPTGAMPSFKDDLTDQQIQDLVRYVRLLGRPS